MMFFKVINKNFFNLCYSKQGIFKADFQTVSQVIISTEKYNQFIPWCTQSKIIQRISEFQNYTKLTISFNKFKNLDYLSHVLIQKQQNQVKVQSLCKDYPLNHLQSIWNIKRQSDFQTKVLYNIDFQFSSPLFRLTSNVFLNFMGEQMWHIFGSKSEALYVDNKNFKNEQKTKIQNKIVSNSVQIKSTMKTDSLMQFLQKHQKLKQKYMKDSLFKAKADSLYEQLKKTQNLEKKLQFQLKNILVHYQ